MAARQVRTRTAVAPKEVRMRIAKETSGAVRFVEISEDGTKRIDDDDGALIGYQYMRKKALAEWLGSEGVPKVIGITLTVIEP